MASLFAVGSAADNCDSFAPCFCLPGGLNVVCDDPVATIKTVFSKSKVKSIEYLLIAVKSGDSKIPANFTGNVKIIGGLEFICPIDDARPNLPKPGICIYIFSIHFLLTKILMFIISFGCGSSRFQSE